MKIELSKSGGLFASLKKASTEVDWTDEEAEHIISLMAGQGEEGHRDAVYYTLDLKDKSVTVDLQKVPANYKAVFDELQNNMKVERH